MKQAFLPLLLSASCLFPLTGKDRPESLDKKATEIHFRVLTIDTHCDTPMRATRRGREPFDLGVRHEPLKRGSGMQDFPRMKEGGLDGSFFAVFVGQEELTPEGREAAYREAVQTLDAMDEVFKKYPDQAKLALKADDLKRIAVTGKRAIFLGLENGYPLGLDVNRVDEFYRRGIRYITLAHTSDNDLADSSTDQRDPEDKGLSETGRRVVHRMNELGIMVDVSHISDRAFYDVLKESSAPVIASHSSARAICDHPRNLSDEMLLALKKNGGVIQLCILSDYIRPSAPNPARDEAFKAMRKKFGEYGAIKDPAVREALHQEYERILEEYPQELATVKDAVDHIDHIVKTIGIDYVGIGTDFDGGGGLADCNDVTQMVNITKELVRRGYSEKEIAKIWGGNFLRVFRAVEARRGGRASSPGPSL